MAVTNIKDGNGIHAVNGGAGGIVVTVAQFDLQWGGSISSGSGSGITATNTQTTTNTASFYGKQGTGSGASGVLACGLWGDSNSSTGVVATSVTGEALYR